MNTKDFPPCDRTDCFACENGLCRVLTSNNFYRECPFYKTREQLEEERIVCRKRLAVKYRIGGV